MREGLELLVGEGRRRGTEEGDDLVIGVGDGAQSGEGQEKGGSAAAAAGGEATVAAAAAARGCRRGAPRRDEACVYESRGGEGVERDVEGCFSKEDEVSRRSFGESRRAAASRASSPSPSPSVERILRKLLRAPLAPWRPAPQRGSVSGESSCVHWASRSVARFERPPLPRPRRRLKVFESSVVGSRKERRKNQKRRLWRVAALSFSRQPSISREVYEPARGARAEMAKEAREGMVDGRVEGFSSREREAGGRWGKKEVRKKFIFPLLHSETNGNTHLLTFFGIFSFFSTVSARIQENPTMALSRYDPFMSSALYDPFSLFLGTPLGGGGQVSSSRGGLEQRLRPIHLDVKGCPFFFFRFLHFPLFRSFPSRRRRVF